MCCAGDLGSIPGLGRSLGEGNGNPLQYSCLGNPMDRGACRAIVHGVAKELDITWRLNHHHHHIPITQNPRQLTGGNYTKIGSFQ